MTDTVKDQTAPGVVEAIGALTALRASTNLSDAHVWAQVALDFLTQDAAALAEGSLFADQTETARLPMTPDPSLQGAEASKLADAVVLRICEYDDRTSPEDWPEALLITPDELHTELMQFAEDLLAALPEPPSKSAESEHVEPEGEVDALVAEADPLRPIISPPREASPGKMEWEEIVSLFERNGLPPPPWRLRDVLVGHLVWARYGDRLASALSSRRATGMVCDVCGLWCSDSKADAILSRVAPPSKPGEVVR